MGTIAGWPGAGRSGQHGSRRGLASSGRAGRAAVTTDLLQRGIREVIAPELTVRCREAGVGGWRSDAIPDVPLVHLGGLGKVAVALVETGELQAGRSFRHRVRRRITQLIEVVLLLSEIADEGWAAQDSPPSATPR